ncbi:MAG: ABC transporter ATP-binding protein [Rickettsiaceae bacterium]|nr:ABC transporter ATP-binding protein [Rickettsiaceae bacterium]
MKNQKIIYEILRLIFPYKYKMLLAFVALIAVVACQVGIGYAIKAFVDGQFQFNDALIRLLSFVVILAFASFVRAYIVNSVSELAANSAKRSGFCALLSFDQDNLSKYTYSDLLSRINEDSEHIATLIINITSFFVRNFLATIACIICMFTLSLKLTVILFIIIVILVCFAVLSGRFLKELTQSAESAKSLASEIIMESIINHKVINIFCSQNEVIAHYDSLNNIAILKAIRRIWLRAMFFAFIIGLILLTLIFIVWIGNLEVSSGRMTHGSFASFMIFGIVASFSFGGVIEMLSSLEKNLVKSERILNIISENYQITGEEQIDISKNKRLSLRNISFSYKNDKHNKILSDVSIDIELGKFNVIIGKSGLGKTTILNLIAGLYRPDMGFFDLDGKKFTTFSPKNWQGHLSYVPQDSLLFSGNIIDNITFFSPEPDIDLCNQMIRGLDLDDFVNALESGIFSSIGDLSTKISGGQKQRIAIARALYVNPSILILDEATSQLDEKTESKILDFVLEKMKNKTVISAAHRSVSIKKAQKLIDLGNVIKSI